MSKNTKSSRTEGERSKKCKKSATSTTVPVSLNLLQNLMRIMEIKEGLSSRSWKKGITMQDKRSASEGAKGFNGGGPEDVLVVEGGYGGSDERTNPENPVVVPGLVLVVYHGGPETPGRVYSGAGDWDCRQVDHEHREPNRKFHYFTII
ncbi:P-loop containing nucleoside triphosphatehydrolases superfamily protein [Striga asiatica]|uniref:P-loop containing nucleoside triphosphatehydrolases superfamily protein n=1 Tax=Striga asiatica TaxID=4170 RepID=A0A5A7R113_STRAF|nr:P-loop containing nucleoside triphosphatehydrolases superfamily protein [Striga asiatica]